MICPDCKQDTFGWDVRVGAWYCLHERRHLTTVPKALADETARLRAYYERQRAIDALLADYRRLQARARALA